MRILYHARMHMCSHQNHDDDFRTAPDDDHLGHITGSRLGAGEAAEAPWRLSCAVGPAVGRSVAVSAPTWAGAAKAGRRAADALASMTRGTAAGEREAAAAWGMRHADADADADGQALASRTRGTAADGREAAKWVARGTGAGGR
jgi:hypothetical protein